MSKVEEMCTRIANFQEDVRRTKKNLRTYRNLVHRVYCLHLTRNNEQVSTLTLIETAKSNFADMEDISPDQLAWLSIDMQVLIYHIWLSRGKQRDLAFEKQTTYLKLASVFSNAMKPPARLFLLAFFGKTADFTQANHALYKLIKCGEQGRYSFPAVDGLPDRQKQDERSVSAASKALELPVAPVERIVAGARPAPAQQPRKNILSDEQASESESGRSSDKPQAEDSDDESGEMYRVKPADLRVRTQPRLKTKLYPTINDPKKTAKMRSLHIKDCSGRLKSPQDRGRSDPEPEADSSEDSMIERVFQKAIPPRAANKKPQEAKTRKASVAENALNKSSGTLKYPLKAQTTRAVDEFEDEEQDERYGWSKSRLVGCVKKLEETQASYQRHAEEDARQIDELKTELLNRASKTKSLKAEVRRLKAATETLGGEASQAAQELRRQQRLQEDQSGVLKDYIRTIEELKKSSEESQRQLR